MEETRAIYGDEGQSLKQFMQDTCGPPPRAKRLSRDHVLVYVCSGGVVVGFVLVFGVGLFSGFRVWVKVG